MNIHTDLNVLSAFCWLRATDSNDLTWLLIDRTKEADEEELQKVFQELNNQLIDELGISEDHLNYLHKLRAFNIAKAAWLISNNNYDFTMFEIARLELERATKTTVSKKNKFSDKINAERILGFNIALKEVSVIEYYSYLSEADKIARSMSAKK